MKIYEIFGYAKDGVAVGPMSIKAKNEEEAVTLMTYKLFIALMIEEGNDSAMFYLIAVGKILKNPRRAFNSSDKMPSYYLVKQEGTKKIIITQNTVKRNYNEREKKVIMAFMRELIRRLHPEKRERILKSLVGETLYRSFIK